MKKPTFSKYLWIREDLLEVLKEIWAGPEKLNHWCNSILRNGVRDVPSLKRGRNWEARRSRWEAQGASSKWRWRLTRAGVHACSWACSWLVRWEMSRDALVVGNKYRFHVSIYCYIISKFFCVAIFLFNNQRNSWTQPTTMYLEIDIILNIDISI